MKKILTVFLILILALTFTAVNADDLADVKSSGVLRMGVPSEYIPFIFFDEAGNNSGIDVALVQEIGRRMGVQVQTVNLAFDGLIDALNLGQVDIIGGAFSKTAEREKLIDFTRVYYNGSAQFISLNTLTRPQPVTLDSFRDLKIGVQKGTSFDQWVKTNLVSPGYVSTRNVYIYATAADEMKALDRKDVDLAVLDQDIYEDIYRGKGKYQVFYDGFSTENYAFGLRKNSTLTSVANGHLTDMIKDGTAQTIANRFFKMDFSEAQAGIARPSSVATPVPVIPVVVIPTQSPASACTNGMVFVSDVTITDGHQVYQGEKFRKIWRIKNTGSCVWNTNYTFVFVSGDQMSGRNISVPQIVQPGQTVDLGVDMVAPNANGTYRGYWQMRSPQGLNFGETIWAKVRVNGANPSGRVIPSISAFYPDFYSGTSGTCPTVYWKTGNSAMIEVKVDGKSVIKSYTVNGSQQICGPLLSYGSHNVELAALSSTDTAYASFTYVTKQGEEGQKRVVPTINYFYPSSNSGDEGTCPTVFWSVSNSGSVDISVDGVNYERRSEATGAITVCGALMNPGNHTVGLTAHTVTDDKSASFSYTTKGEEGQKRVIPSIDYFYVDPTSGYMGDSATAYWSVSNAGGIDLTVDGNNIAKGGSGSGSAPINATIQSVGTHAITLTAHSVTDDTTSTVYFTMKEEEPRVVIPVIDSFYVNPSSGTMGDSTTAYWSVSNAASVDVLVDGMVIASNQGPNGSAPISATIQSVGTHTITLRARSVTMDVTSDVYYTMEDQGGWAGSNYYDNMEDQGGWAGSNYYDNTEDQGGWAGSGYYDNTEDQGGWAGSGYYDEPGDQGGGADGSGYYDEPGDQTGGADGGW